MTGSLIKIEYHSINSTGGFDRNSTTKRKHYNTSLIAEVDTTIMSPNYPEDYGPDADCIIEIEFPKDKRVQLQFQYFKLEKNPDCRYDYLEIIDPFDELTFDYYDYSGYSSYVSYYSSFSYEYGSETPRLQNNSLNRKCGHSVPPPFTSKGNTLKLKFKSDRATNEKGFKMIATTGMLIKNPNVIQMIIS